jgi:hypothetical protein
VTGSCEHINEPSGSIKCGNFFTSGPVGCYTTLSGVLQTFWRNMRPPSSGLNMAGRHLFTAIQKTSI